MTNFLLEATTEATTEGSSALTMLASFLPLILMVVIFYFLLIRPQRKRDKEVQRMRANLEVGDEIVTNGGIIGRVVLIKDETVIIETGSDRSKIRIARWAIAQNNTIHDDVAAE